MDKLPSEPDLMSRKDMKVTLRLNISKIKHTIVLLKVEFCALHDQINIFNNIMHR